MNKAKRQAWIKEWVQKNTFVDVLNCDFVFAYIKATGVPFEDTNWGAPKCRTLGQDLAGMVHDGTLSRRCVGLSGNWQPGFPRWVWTYTLANGQQEKP